MMDAAPAPDLPAVPGLRAPGERRPGPQSGPVECARQAADPVGERVLVRVWGRCGTLGRWAVVRTAPDVLGPAVSESIGDHGHQTPPCEQTVVSGIKNTEMQGSYRTHQSILLADTSYQAPELPDI